MLYTSYFSQIRNFPNNIIPIGISRIPPSWYKGENLKNLSPSFNLLTAYKNNKISEAAYNKCYYEEVLNNLNLSEIINIFQNIAYKNFPNCSEDILLSKNYHLALCCFEKSEDFCHRHLFSSFFNQKTGYNIEELKWNKELHLFENLQDEEFLLDNI